MKYKFDYFKRDISWLSFNYRVLMEADDDSLPLYERIQFVAIHASNLDEFYEVRVPEQKTILESPKKSVEQKEEARLLILDIEQEVRRQSRECFRIFYHKLLPELAEQGVHLYPSSQVHDFHKEYVHRYFMEEVFPYMLPVLVDKERVLTFLRHGRVYIAIRLYKENEKGERTYDYFVIKQPNSRLSRFVDLPKHKGEFYMMFLEDLIKANIAVMFPGYMYDASYCLKLTRDADVAFNEDVKDSDEIVHEIRSKIKKRKIGAITRFVYDRKMPEDFLAYLCEAFAVSRQDVTPMDAHLNMKDLFRLPCPIPAMAVKSAIQPMTLNCLNEQDSMFAYARQQDLLLNFPYHSFDHLIHMLYEAVHDPCTQEIKMTQYRVAENSAVINTLISAAQHGKKVTVFVELKARFDEENNLATAAMMRHAGIHIKYSMPGLKVHSKVALIIRRDEKGERMTSFAYVGTGNFNEKTAKQYTDLGLVTCHKPMVDDLIQLFAVLERKNPIPKFHHLLVTKFNYVEQMKNFIHYEMELAERGEEAHIIIKLNSLQDPAMIDELYRASLAGVKIDLIIRGICCLVPDQPYSQNIKVTRIVDTFLEHSRIFYFAHGGKPKVYMGSADWMKRNLYRRIEATTPILDEKLQAQVYAILQIQLRDNQKACWINHRLENIRKPFDGEHPIRAQYATYAYWKALNTSK